MCSVYRPLLRIHISYRTCSIVLNEKGQALHAAIRPEVHGRNWWFFAGCHSVLQVRRQHRRPQAHYHRVYLDVTVKSEHLCKMRFVRRAALLLISLDLRQCCAGRWRKVVPQIGDFLPAEPIDTQTTDAASSSTSLGQHEPFTPPKRCPAGANFEDHRCMRDQGRHLPTYRVVCTFDTWRWDPKYKQHRRKMRYIVYEDSCPVDHVCIEHGPLLRTKRKRNDLRPPTRISCVLPATIGQPPLRPRRGSRAARSVAVQQPEAVADTVVIVESSLQLAAALASQRPAEVESPIATAAAAPLATEVYVEDDDWSWLSDIEMVPNLYDNEIEALFDRRHAVDTTHGSATDESPDDGASSSEPRVR